MWLRPVVLGESTTSVQVDESQFKFGHAQDDEIAKGSVYGEAFPCSLIRHRNTFYRTDRRVRERETCAFVALGGRQGQFERQRCRTEWTIGRHPGISIWLITAAKHIVRTKILKIICRQLQYPHHLKRVQDISCKTALPERICVSGFLPQYARNLFLVYNVVHRRDRAYSWRYHELRQSTFVGRFQSVCEQSIAIPVAIVSTNCKGRRRRTDWYSILQHKLTRAIYHEFLHRYYSISHYRKDMYWEHKSPPFHFSISFRTFLHDIYPERWEGGSGRNDWPAMSPDKNPLFFCLWGNFNSIMHIKFMVQRDCNSEFKTNANKSVTHLKYQ